MPVARANLFSARPLHASRIKDAFDELNKFAASPKHGASLEQIKAIHKARMAQPTPKGAVSEYAVSPSCSFDADPSPYTREDLVGRLINDPENKELWFTKLLGNKFCKEMGSTGPSDPGASAVLKGFQAYMVVSN